MIYVIELIKGIMLAFGVILGFLIPFVYLIAKAKKADSYLPSDLIEPFKDYLRKIKDDEHYEQISEVKRILFFLEDGNKIVDEVKTFSIRKETLFSIDTKGDKSTFQSFPKYTVIGKIKPTKP